MNALPLVTIAIPLYNSARYIDETIRSVRDQTYANMELLIYDDASTDGSLEVALSHAALDHRVRVIASSINLGPEANWNRCLSEVRGKYLKLLCGDDTLSPDCLERQVAIMESPDNHDVALVSCGRWIIDSAGRRLIRRRYSTTARKIPGKDAIREIACFGTNPIGEPGCGLFRSALIAVAGTFSARYPYVIDLDYWVKLLRHGAWFVQPECLFSFRISRESWSARLHRVRVRQYLDFAQGVARREGISRRPMARTAAAIRAHVGNVVRQLIFRFLS
jgi:glycosyltransferase involved in cell wall biosynthesis